MDYSKIKREILNLNKSITACRRQKTTLEKELSDIALERKKANANYQISVTKSNENAKKHHVEKVLLPLQKQQAELNEKLEALKKEEQQTLDELTEENLMKDCSDQQEIIAEVKRSSDELREAVQGIVGERFYNELVSQLEAPTVVTDVEQLATVVDYFNVCEQKIARISRHSGKITKLVNKIQSAIMQLNADAVNSDSQMMVPIVILFCILVFLCFKMVFPVYVVLLLFAFIFNVQRHYTIFKVLSVQKIVRDNVENIEQMFKQQVLEQLDKKRQKIKDKYEKKYDECNSELERVEEQIKKMSTTALDSFSFDSSELRKDFDLAMAQKSAREEQISTEIHELEKKIAKACDELEEKKKLLQTELGSVQSQYLTTEVSTSYKWDPKYIQDIKDSKVDFFTHPASSCLFLYDDFSDVINFIKLLIFQTRGKLNPFAYNTLVFDPTNIGKDFLKFKPDNPNNEVFIEKLFQILTTDSDFLEYVDEANNELTKRSTRILQAYGSLEEYNEYMLSIDSLTESYEFVYGIDLASNTLDNAALQQILRVGGDTGIIFNLFLKEKIFLGLGKTTTNIINSVHSVFILSSSGAKSRAKDWVLDKIKEEKEKKKSM